MVGFFRDFSGLFVGHFWWAFLRALFLFFEGLIIQLERLAPLLEQS